MSLGNPGRPYDGTMSTGYTRWDPSEDLETPEDVVAYLQAVLEETDDITVFQAALGDVARAQGMTAIGHSVSMPRSSPHSTANGCAH